MGQILTRMTAKPNAGGSALHAFRRNSADSKDDAIAPDTRITIEEVNASDLEEAPTRAPNDSDIQPLLGAEAQPNLQDYSSWRSKKGFKSCLYSLKEPAATVLINSIVVLTALTPAINAFAAPSHVNPGELSLEWWNSLTTLQQAHSATCFFASFGSNYAFSRILLPEAFHSVIANVPQMGKSPKKFAENFISIVFSLCAATASGAISYKAFHWLPKKWETSIPAGTAVLSSSASRYAGMIGIQTRIKNYFCENIVTQKQFFDMLQHVDKSMLQQLEREFTIIKEDVMRKSCNAIDGPTPYNKRMVKGQFFQITKQLATQLDSMVTTAKENGLPHINEHTRTERAVYAAGFLFNIILGVFALAPALASFFTHMQKGFEGAGLIIPGVSHLGIWGKRAVGFMPGVAPAMLYANSTLDIPGLLLLMAAASFKSPLRSLPLAMLVLVANYFAAGSMQTVSEHIASDKENIIGFNETTNSALCVAYILFTTLGGAFANLKPSIQLAFSKTVTLEKITLNQYIEHLGHNSNKISDGTREKLRSLSIFKPVVIPSGQDNDPVPTGPVYV